MTIVKLQHVTPQALGILQLMWLANHYEFLIIIDTNLEQKMGSPSEGWTGIQEPTDSQNYFLGPLSLLCVFNHESW